jgi:aspartyl-tRNA(Asn)/glutamyl-tRNA(Gln) amidotransferase subunit A
VVVLPSIPAPAAACGVSTLRSARGRISRYGVIPLSPSFDVAGPMARRMLDISILMRVLAGHDPRDPATLDEPCPPYPLEPPRDLTGTRIGLPIEMSWQQVDEGIAAVCREALELLVSRGAELVEIENPPNTDIVLGKSTGVFDTINDSEAYQIHDALVPHSHLYTPQVRERVRKGEDIPRHRYEEALRLRSQWTQDWRELMRTHRLDAIAHPTIDAAPPLIDHTQPPQGPRIRLSVPWSIADFPSLNVPAGLDHRGLPVGLSLAALPQDEPDLLSLGILIDEEQQLWRHGPPISSTTKDVWG